MKDVIVPEKKIILFSTMSLNCFSLHNTCVTMIPFVELDNSPLIENIFLEECYQTLMSAATPCTHRILNNSDWWEGVGAVNFVSEIARHFRLSAMLRKER